MLKLPKIIKMTLKINDEPVPGNIALKLLRIIRHISQKKGLVFLLIKMLHFTSFMNSSSSDLDLNSVNSPYADIEGTIELGRVNREYILEIF